MATEFRESNVAGTKYERAFRIEIDYPDDGIPSAVMLRERKYVLADGTKLSEPMSPLKIPFDTTRAYPLLNPETGEMLGSDISLMDIFVALYSIFVARSVEEEEKWSVFVTSLAEWALQFPEEERAAKIAEAERLYLLNN